MLLDWEMILYDTRNRTCRERPPRRSIKAAITRNAAEGVPYSTLYRCWCTNHANLLKSQYTALKCPAVEKEVDE
jgi:hypothetical protein